MIPIICVSHICECANALEFAIPKSIHVHVQTGKRFGSPDVHVPSPGQTRQQCLIALALMLKVSFLVIYSGLNSLQSCAFFLAISLFKIAPRRSVEVLSRVPKGRKTVMSLMKKIHARQALFRYEFQCCWL